MRLFYTKETQLQNDAIKFLKARKIFHWRQNSGALKTEKGFYRFTSINGLPDIIAIINGRFVGFELKLKGKYPSREQKATHKRIKEAGGRVYIIHDLNELKEAVENENRCKA